MIAPIHTLRNENNTVSISGSRLSNVTVKTMFNTFRNVDCFYYTATNHITGESATYAHIEVTPNTLPNNVVPFLFERLAWYNANNWRVSYGDTVQDIFPS